MKNIQKRLLEILADDVYIDLNKYGGKVCSTVMSKGAPSPCLQVI